MFVGEVETRAINNNNKKNAAHIKQHFLYNKIKQSLILY